MPPLFLWHGRDRAEDLSLLGSIHALSDPALPQEVETAFEQAEGLIFEADVRQFDPAVNFLPDDLALSLLVSPQTYELLLRRTEELGIDPADLEGLTIPACAFRLAVEAGVQSGFDFMNHGLDSQLRLWAEEAGKPIGYLERPGHIPSSLARLPLPIQDRWLAFTLLGLPSVGDRLRAAEAAWRAGDLDQLARALLVDEMRRVFPEVREVLFCGRNRRWTDSLAGAMPFGHRVLVVVGSGHFWEPEGLLSLLGDRGYHFTQAGT